MSTSRIEFWRMHVNCLGCNRELEEVFDGSAKNNQFIDALDLKWIGGYGEKIDGSSIHFSLCSQCSDKFLDLFPNVKQAFENS